MGQPEPFEGFKLVYRIDTKKEMEKGQIEREEEMRRIMFGDEKIPIRGIRLFLG